MTCLHSTHFCHCHWLALDRVLVNAKFSCSTLSVVRKRTEEKLFLNRATEAALYLTKVCVHMSAEAWNVKTVKKLENILLPV